MFRPQFLLVQGRTLPQCDDSLQSFPDRWMDEFPLIQELGFDGIEWIYDKKSENDNPILNLDGQDKIKHISSEFDIELENIVFDWFLAHPLFENDGISLRTKTKKLNYLIDQSEKIGFKRIIFPILEKNALDTHDKMDLFLKLFSDEVIPNLRSKRIEIDFETSLPPADELEFMTKLDHEKIRICFDMGNSASLGYDCDDVLDKISPFLGSVHIKDRHLHGNTVPLGEGDVEFVRVFKSLHRVGFIGPFSFQAYRDENSDNLQLLEKYLKFINNIMKQCGYGSKKNL